MFYLKIGWNQCFKTQKLKKYELRFFCRYCIINYCFSEGIYPDIWKLEYVTPVPKVHPPENLSDLRRISGLLNLSKITDKIIAEIISQDMQHTRDRAQYGNLKKVSLQHYLVKMMNKILSSIDQNSVKQSDETTDG